MLLLALDTCDSRGSLALLRDEVVLGHAVHDVDEDYSRWLLPAIQGLLKTAGTKLAEIDVYAVACGPGLFTGARLSLATVKAWSEVFGKSIAAVSRLMALASCGPGDAPFAGAFVDANRGQVFASLYERHGRDGKALRTSRLQLIGEEMVIGPEDFVKWAAERAGGQRLDWISLDPECLSATVAWKARSAQGESIFAAPPILAPAVGKLGYALACEGKFTDTLALDANYVRRTDAELFLATRTAAQTP